MIIIKRGVIDWETCQVIEQESYDYSGPVASCKDSGSAPQPTDPYAQAAAQYGLSTGTAAYNAALNHTDSSNPLGSNSWNIVGYSGQPSYTPPSSSNGGSSPYNIAPGAMTASTASGGYTYPDGSPAPAGGGFSLQNGGYAVASGSGGSSPIASSPGVGIGFPSAGSIYGLGSENGSGAPLYSQNTSLTPWANQMLSSPIDTSGVPGMPGGPDVSQNDYLAQAANYNQQMGLLRPQEQMQSEQNQAQLEAEGAMPGSAAYDYGTQEIGREQTFANQQAADSAIGAGNQEEVQLYNLGSQGLQNQLAVRNAPISEYESLQGNPSSQVSAATPDISGAFGQQYSGALAGYNANVATNNSNESSLAALAAAAAMYY